MIDGYSRFGAFIRMVIPISTSGILTVVIRLLSEARKLLREENREIIISSSPAVHCATAIADI